MRIPDVGLSRSVPVRQRAAPPLADHPRLRRATLAVLVGLPLLILALAAYQITMPMEPAPTPTEVRPARTPRPTTAAEAPAPAGTVTNRRATRTALALPVATPEPTEAAPPAQAAPPAPPEAAPTIGALPVVVDSTALDVYIGSALPVVERMQQQFELVMATLGEGGALQQSCLALSPTDSPLALLRNDAAQLRVLTAPPPLSAYQDQLRQTAQSAEELAQRVMACGRGEGDQAQVRESLRGFTDHLATSLTALRGYGAAAPLPPSTHDPDQGDDPSRATYEVTNETGSPLYVELSGPRRTSVMLPDQATERLQLPPGDYRVLAVVNAINVSPLRGQETLEAGATTRARYTTRPSGIG
jgi:hypothetical protein